MNYKRNLRQAVSKPPEVEPHRPGHVGKLPANVTPLHYDQAPKAP